MVVGIEREKIQKRIRTFRGMVLLQVALITLLIFQVIYFGRLAQPYGGFDNSEINLYLWMFACYSFTLVVSWWRLQRDIRATRTDHHLMLNAEDLTLHNGHQQIAIPWGDIIKVKKGWYSQSPITIKLDPDSQYDRSVYRLQPVYELDQKRLHGEIEQAWFSGRDKLS